MKKTIFFLALAAVLCSSCRYKEGPGISFVSPEYRIAGNWNLEKVYLDRKSVV